MTERNGARSLVYHRWVVLTTLVLAVPSLVGFRLLVELGLGTGSLRLFGIPLEYPFLAWCLALLALAWDRARTPEPARSRATLYEWWIGVVGVAGVMWLGQRLATTNLSGATPVYWLASTGAVAVFISSSCVSRAGLGVVRYFGSDAVRILRRPVTWCCVIGTVCMFMFGPRSSDVPVQGQAFERWYARRQREVIPARWQPSPVTLVEFVDYQCPVCKTSAAKYQEVIAGATAKYGELFSHLKVDFPLDTECNSLGRGAGGDGSLHPAACEAAVAARLARANGKDAEDRVTAWLWEHQSEMTPDLVFDGVGRALGIDMRAHYAAHLPEVARDIEDGRRLRVLGTPAFFVNGRRLPLVPAESMAAAIAAEVETVRGGPDTPSERR